MPNCSVVGCDYGLAKKDGTYVSYRLPKDPKISQKWLELLNRDNYVPSINTCICHRHFEEDAFFRFVHVFYQKISILKFTHYLYQYFLWLEIFTDQIYLYFLWIRISTILYLQYNYIYL